MPWQGRPNRLSRDLHDGVGQSLNILLVEIRVALERGFAQRDDLLILEREAENAIQSVRALAYRARQRSLVEHPLDDARRYAERLVAANRASLRWVDECTRIRLAAQVARELAWSIRESITNAVYHGLARTVEVRLTEGGGCIRATIRDDGRGFEPDLARVNPAGRGLGLLGNQERMESIGGLFSVRSHPGHGTVVVLEVPRFRRRRSPGQPSVHLLIEPPRLRAAEGGALHQ